MQNPELSSESNHVIVLMGSPLGYFLFGCFYFCLSLVSKLLKGSNNTSFKCYACLECYYSVVHALCMPQMCADDIQFHDYNIVL